MGARSFFYVAAGLFLLAAAFTLGARSARADLDRNNGTHIIGLSSPVVLRSDGTAWLMGDLTGPWIEYNNVPPPVPLEDVLFWDVDTIMARDGHAWRFYSADQQWHRSRDPLPLPSPVSTEAKSMSGVKDAYRGK